MRVVLDTNVIISGVISRGPPYQILAAWREQRFTVIVSPALIAEYARAVRYPRASRAHGLDEDAIERFVSRFSRFGELVVPRRQVRHVTSDPDDDRILECAEEGHATHIITGDPHLRDLGNYQGIPILSPRAFIDLLNTDR